MKAIATVGQFLAKKFPDQKVTQRLQREIRAGSLLPGVQREIRAGSLLPGVQRGIRAGSLNPETVLPPLNWHTKKGMNTSALTNNQPHTPSVKFAPRSD